MKVSIGEIPYRKGKWLSITDGSVFHPIAKFRNEEAFEKFVEWCQEVDGTVFNFTEEEAG